MKSGARAKYLVVDTTGFIKNLQFQELAENVITLEDVTNEIKCRRQLKRLAVLPYDLIIKDVFPENIKTVSEFSKKTGDYPSLSAVDMKVMALTYQLEKEHVGTEHLNIKPHTETSIEGYKPSVVSFDNIAGFYIKDKEMSKVEESAENSNDLITEKMKDLEVRDIDITENPKDFSTHSEIDNLKCSSQEENKTENVRKEVIDEPEEGSNLDKNLDTPKTHSLSEVDEISKINSLNEDKDISSQSPHNNETDIAYSSDEGSLSDDDSENRDKFSEEIVEPSDDNMILKRVNEEKLDANEISDDDSIYDDDDCGWITPDNVAQAKRESVAGLLSDEHVTVACLTTDFAMQNVLIQMGLNVMSVDGRIIKQVRTYILRCHACGKTTSIMTKIFCSKCGLKTLKRVAVSIDPDGKQHIYINYRRQITAKGKRWSIPKPQGGKHANNPILVEDQRIPQQRLSKKAMQRTNALDPDYIAGYSPFVMRDTNSRSIMLGFHTSRQNIKNLVGRNPHSKHGKKKK